jgi:hypothetical protein
MVPAASKYIQKALSYRRADWLQEPPAGATFESFLRQALAKLATVGQSAIVRDSGQVLSCAKRDVRPKGGVFLHITAVTPGGEASVIRSKDIEAAEELDVGTVTPPEDQEFMDGDVFLFVRKNSVCVCSNAIHDGTIGHYFYRLYAKAKLNDASQKFHIVSVADIDRVKFINDHDIKSITFNAALYKASNDMLKNAKRTRGAAGAVAKFLTAMLGKERDVTKDSLVIHLTLETDGRMKKHLRLGESRLTQWALDLVTNEEADDDYAIVTTDNQVIRPHELKVRKISNILVKGNSVDREDAWKALLAFYGELCDSGAVEE